MKKITKLTLIADNGILKNLIHDLINHTELKMFDKNFLASMEKTNIFLTEKDGLNVTSDDWNKLLKYINEKTTHLPFSIVSEYTTS